MAGLHRLQPEKWQNETFPAPAYACGLRAYIDHEQGWHKSLSNVPVKNVLGMSRHVFWSLQAEDSDANSLNNKEITTIIRRNGFRFWGNRTPETNAYIFEVYTRTAQVLADSIAEAQFETIDSPLTPANVKDVISAIRAKLDSLVTAGKLIGAECWYDVVDNSTTGLRQDVCVFATNIRQFPRWKTWSFTSRLLMNSWSRICGAGRCLMAVPKHLRFLRCLWMVKTKWVR